MMTEAEWQEQVIELAHLLGWEHMHVRRSIGKGSKWTTATNVSGWPDLTLWSERHRMLLFVELKSDIGKLTPDQNEVHRSLQAAGQAVLVWRPADLPAVQRVLTFPRAWMSDGVTEFVEVDL